MKILQGKLLILSLTLLGSLTHLEVRAEEIRYEQQIEDLAFGQALFDFYQNNTLQAITRIETAKKQALLPNRPEDANLLLGGLYFEYGLENEAELIFNNLLGTRLDQLSRNRVWFSLARLHYSNNNLAKASELLQRIDAPLTAQREAQKQYMLCSIHLQNQDFPEAIKAAEAMDGDSIWLAYCQYNLGVSLINDGQHQQGKDWLGQLSRQRTDDAELFALQDAANLALGMHELKQSPLVAADYFAQIQLSSSFSNQALLGTGWTYSQRRDYRKALAYWKALEKRQQSDEASQEVLLAMAEGIEQMGNDKLAIQFYQNASVRYDAIFNQMNDHIAGIEKGTLMNTLSRRQVVDDANYDILDETLKDLPATPFLQGLIADDRFQNALKTYQELLYIRSSLSVWKDNLPALKLMLKERRALFESKRPQIQQATDFDRLAELQRQRDTLENRVKTIEQTGNYRALANEQEMDYLLQLDSVQRTINRLQANSDNGGRNQHFPNLSRSKQWQAIDLGSISEKHRIMSGLMKWQLSTEFPRRFFSLKRELNQLNDALDQASLSAQSLVNAIQKNQQLLDDFDQRIDGQDQVIRGLRLKLDSLIEQQQEQINQLAIAAIEQRKQHLEQYRIRARYALALLQDKMTRESQ